MTTVTKYESIDCSRRVTHVIIDNFSPLESILSQKMTKLSVVVGFVIIFDSNVSSEFLKKHLQTTVTKYESIHFSRKVFHVIIDKCFPLESILSQNMMKISVAIDFRIFFDSNVLSEFKKKTFSVDYCY